ncbi:MAG: ECF family RNA polymerase sigma factor SbrI [Ktedonobacteraceae bacterium]
MMYQEQREEGVDESPGAVLYQRHAHTILRYVSRYVSLKEDADDLVLEVFMVALGNKIWVNWSESEQLAWLRRIAHNKMVDHLRRISHRPSVILDDALDLLLEDEYRSPEQTALRNEDHVQLRAHLNQLSALQQEIVRLRFAYDLRTKEIAQIVNTSDNVVRVMLSRALNSLRRVYNRQEGA